MNESASAGGLEEEILARLGQGASLTHAEIVAMFPDATEREVGKALARLRQAEQISADRGVYWVGHLAPDAHTQPQPQAAEVAVGKLGEHAQQVYTALKHGGREAGTVAGIIAATGLSDAQVRYAISRLLMAEAIVMVGGRGRRGTYYEPA